MLSIVIPTLNEAERLPATLRHTLRAAGNAALDIIVSDCGSRDGTARVAQDLGVRVTFGGDCRATALNAGARVARGDVLLFLHADSLLPQDFPGLIDRALADPRGIVAGAFDFSFCEEDDPRASSRIARHCLRWVVLCNRVRYRWTGNFYGDQCIFVRRDIFDAIGGFPHVRLMEDIAFCQRLHRFGRSAILRPSVRTSPRRFLDHGVVRQFMQDLALLTCGSVGLSPLRLWDRYNAWNHRVRHSREPAAVAARTASPAVGAA